MSDAFAGAFLAFVGDCFHVLDGGFPGMVIAFLDSKSFGRGLFVKLFDLLRS